MTDGGGSRHLAVAASLALHAGAFALAWQVPPPPQQPLLQTAPMQVTLLAPMSPRATDAAASVAHPSARPAPLPETGDSVSDPAPALTDAAAGETRSLPDPIGESSARETRADDHPPAAAATAPASAAAAMDTGAATAPYSGEQVLASLERAFSAHFHYPMLARRQGWEGDVTLALRVEIDGRLTGIHVIGSSGHRVLDDAAVDCLVRARAVTLPGGALGGSLDMVLPVQYRLLDARV